MFYTWFLFAADWHSVRTWNQSCIHLSVGNPIIAAFDYCVSFLSHCCNRATDKDSLRGKVCFLSCSRVQSVSEREAWQT